MENFLGDNSTPENPYNSYESYEEGVPLVKIFSFQIARKEKEKTHLSTHFLSSDSWLL